MIIAVDTKNINKNEPADDDFIFEIFGRIIPQHAQHTFVVITEEKINDSFIHFKNVIPVVRKTRKENAAQLYIWYHISLPAILKKYQANIFISRGGTAAAAKIPQCIIVPGLSFIHQPFLYKKSYWLFYKKFIAQSIKKSTAVFTVSQFCKQEIINRYKVNADKIQIVYKGINENFKKINDEQREIIKTKYAADNEYFIYTGEIAAHKNLLNLLKAFSAFKKRQKSNMQLFIAGKQGYDHEKFYEQLRLFRFKDDVKLFKDLSSKKVAELTAAAYAMVYPSRHECFATPPLEAMKSGVAVVASSITVMCEMLADAALYAEPDNFKEIAVKMMQLFKDENLRNQIIEKGKLQAEKYNWQNTSELFWQGIEKCFL